jgi:hypothetical protein
MTLVAFEYSLEPDYLGWQIRLLASPFVRTKPTKHSETSGINSSERRKLQRTFILLRYETLSPGTVMRRTREVRVRRSGGCGRVRVLRARQGSGKAILPWTELEFYMLHIRKVYSSHIIIAANHNWSCYNMECHETILIGILQPCRLEFP